jgi:hypothetical protein
MYVPILLADVKCNEPGAAIEFLHASNSGSPEADAPRVPACHPSILVCLECGIFDCEGHELDVERRIKTSSQ